MTAMPAHPAVIPYVEAHDGPRRLMTIALTSGNVGASKHVPVVGIDGRRYVVVWGVVTFEVPADRNVHVSVHIEADYLTQACSMLLPPGGQPASLRYETHYTSGRGSLTPQT